MEESKRQTAVEWLFEKMTEQGTNPYWDMRFIQAKQMEKEQIIKAHKLGFYYNLPDPIVEKNSENYYNETYKK